MSISPSSLPRDFVWRRVHSLSGLWIVGFLILHLLTNSQAALLIGENGSGFVKAVNDIHDLPYLPAIEILFLAVPFFIHTVWGIQRLFTSKTNSYPSNGTTPSLTKYPRNHAYTWQRITSWILLVGIVAHVIHMRFIEEPATAPRGAQKYYMVRINKDPGIYSLADRLGVNLYDKKQLQQQIDQFAALKVPDILDITPQGVLKTQKYNQEKKWIKALGHRPVGPDQLIAVSDSYGMAELLMVRETFKMPMMLFLYTVLVISSCFHAFNGLWTFLITWGITLSAKSQRVARSLSTVLMLMIAFLGLAAIWGTYWINLKQ